MSVSYTCLMEVKRCTVCMQELAAISLSCNSVDHINVFLSVTTNHSCSPTAGAQYTPDCRPAIAAAAADGNTLPPPAELPPSHLLQDALEKLRSPFLYPLFFIFRSFFFLSLNLILYHSILCLTNVFVTNTKR